MAIIIHLIQPTRRGEKSLTWVGQWVDECGRLRKKTTRTRDKATARTIVREWERRMALDGQGIHDWDRYKNLAWMTVVDEFVGLHTGRPNTLDLYRRSGKQFDRVMKAPLLSRITTATMEDYATKRVAEVKAGTTNKELRHLRAILRWAKRRRYIREAPDFKHAFVREGQRHPVNVPVEVYNAMLAAIPRVHFKHRSAGWWRVFLSIAYQLGLRRGELLGLRWSDVDLRAAELKVSWATSKSRKDRQLPLTDDLVDLLQNWRKEEKSDRVLPWDREPRSLYNDWNLIVAAAGPEAAGVVPKNFRSSTASQLLLSGASTILVRDFLGHSTVAVLEKHYANVTSGLRLAAEARQRQNGRAAG